MDKSYIYIYKIFSPFFKKEKVWSLLTLVSFLPEEVPFGPWDKEFPGKLVIYRFLCARTQDCIWNKHLRCTDHILRSRAYGICVDSLKTFDRLTSSFFQYEKKDSELRFNLEVLSLGSLGSPGWDGYVLSLWLEWSVSAPGSHWHHQCPIQT